MLEEFKRTGVIKKKEYKSGFLKKTSRYISVYIALFLKNYTSITPNQVTLIATITGMIVAILFSIGDHASLIIGAIFFLVYYILDHVDGSLARMKNMASEYGTWLDECSDTFVFISVFLGIAIGVYRTTGNAWVWPLAFMAITSKLFQVIEYITFTKTFSFAKDVIETQKKKYSLIRHFFYEYSFIVSAIIIGAIINQLFYVMLIFSIIGWPYAMIIFYRFSKHIKSNLGH